MKNFLTTLVVLLLLVIPTSRVFALDSLQKVAADAAKLQSDIVAAQSATPDATLKKQIKARVAELQTRVNTLRTVMGGSSADQQQSAAQSSSAISNISIRASKGTDTLFQVISPRLIKGQTYTITWNSTLPSTARYGITLKRKTGTTVAVVSNAVISGTSYAWTVPQNITDLTDGVLEMYDDKTTAKAQSAQFTLTAPSSNAALTVSYPNGGPNVTDQLIPRSSPLQIVFTSSTRGSAALSLRNSDTGAVRGISSSFAVAIGKNTFSYQIPDSLASGHYKVVVSVTPTESTVNAATDESDFPFTLVDSISAVNISSVFPSTGPVGTIVTLTGTGFARNFNDNEISILGRVVPLISSGEYSITFMIPQWVAQYAPQRIPIGYDNLSNVEGSSASFYLSLPSAPVTAASNANTTANTVKQSSVPSPVSTPVSTPASVVTPTTPSTIITQPVVVPAAPPPAVAPATQGTTTSPASVTPIRTATGTPVSDVKVDSHYSTASFFDAIMTVLKSVF